MYTTHSVRAVSALREQGRSLLPRGIVGVSGEFRAGAAVSIRGTDGVEVARGLSAYGSSELKRIAGHRSEEIALVLGLHNGDEAVHRDDLVLIEELPPEARGL